MILLINYLWEGILCLTMLWIFYQVFLERNTFFTWNRAYLLTSLLAALIFPALSFTGFRDMNLLNETYLIQLPIIESGSSNQVQEVSNLFTVFNFVLCIYCIGLLFSLSRFLVGIISLIIKTRKAKATYRGRYTLLEHPSFEPSSFFHFIFLPKGAIKMQQKVDWIIAHEATHADYRHSLDKLLVQLVKVIFWFYPIHLLYEKALEVLHEYQVDQRMTTLYPLDAYARLLLQLTNPVKSGLLVHNFNQFQIKKRLIMMNKPKTKWMARGIYTLALPLFACLFALISCEQNEDMLKLETEQNDKITERIMKDGVFDVVEDMPTPQGGMEGWNNYLKENLDYPQAAKDAKKDGTIYLAFKVNREGELGDVQILRGIGYGLDEEAIRVIKNAPNWVPERQNGENVAVKMRVPIRFKLD